MPKGCLMVMADPSDLGHGKNTKSPFRFKNPRTFQNLEKYLTENEEWANGQTDEQPEENAKFL